jgi:hypothetical protein
VDQHYEAPHPNGAVTVNHRPKRRGVRRNIFVTVLIVVALLWGYAIWYSVARPSPERLDGSAKSAVARACTEARTQLAALPNLTKGATAADDVRLVRQENQILHTMTDRIDHVTPSGSDAHKALDAWVADWRNLIDARAQFATVLQAEGKARLRIPAVKAGSIEPITDRMDTYATNRGLDACRPQALQAEVVDQPRDYSAAEADA